jgi:hypothetical protein
VGKLGLDEISVRQTTAEARPDAGRAIRLSASARSLTACRAPGTQSTVLGVINAELLDLTIPVADAQFSKSGDARDFWTERLDARDEQIVLTWYTRQQLLLQLTARPDSSG